MLGEVMPVRNALKAVGAALAVIALCSPLIFWPVDEAQTDLPGLSQARSPCLRRWWSPPRCPGDDHDHPATGGAGTGAGTGHHDHHHDRAHRASPSRPWETCSLTSPSSSRRATPRRGPTISVRSSRPSLPIWRAPTTRSPTWRRGSPARTRATPAIPCSTRPPSLAYALKTAGVDLVATANNHSLDMGWDGIVGHSGPARRGRPRARGHLPVERGEGRPRLSSTSRGSRWPSSTTRPALNGLTPPEEHEEYAVNTLDVDVVAAGRHDRPHVGGRRRDRPSPLRRRVRAGAERGSRSRSRRRSSSRGVDVIIGAHPHVVQPIAHVVAVQQLEGRSTSTWPTRWATSSRLSGGATRTAGSSPTSTSRREVCAPCVTGVSYLPVYVQRSAAESARALPGLAGPSRSRSLRPTFP